MLADSTNRAHPTDLAKAADSTALAAGTIVMCCFSRIVAAFVLLTCFDACSGSVDAMLTEHKVVTQGGLNGFQIGDGAAQALARVRVLGVYAIDIPAYENHLDQPQLFKPNDLSSAEAASLMKFDCWRFELNEKPAGAFYDLRFLGGKLTEIRYDRPRTQPE